MVPTRSRVWARISAARRHRLSSWFRRLKPILLLLLQALLALQVLQVLQVPLVHVTLPPLPGPPALTTATSILLRCARAELAKMLPLL